MKIDAGAVGWQAVRRAAMLVDRIAVRLGAPRSMSLSRKMMVFFGGLLVATLGLVLIGSHVGTTMVAKRILGRDFAAQNRVFQNIRSLRYDQMQRGAELLADDFGFRAAAASGDAPTILSALDSLGHRMGVTRALFVAPDGTIVGLPRAIGRADRDYLVRAVERGATRGVLRIGGANYRTVAAPVMAPEPIGWAIFMVRLDDRQLAKLAELSAIPVKVRIIPIEQVAPGIPIVTAGSIDNSERRIGGESVVIQATRVAGFGPERPQVMVLQFSLTQALHAYAPLFGLLLGICALALAIGVVGSLYLARRLAQPLEAMAVAVEGVGQGDYGTVEVVTEDEIGRLAAAFNRMVGDIQEREDRIARAQIEATARLEAKIADVQADNRRLNGIAAQQREIAMGDAALALYEALGPLLGAFDAETARLFAAADAMRSGISETRGRASDTSRSALRTERLTNEIALSTGDLARSGEEIAGQARSALQLVREAAGGSAIAATAFAGLRSAVDEIGGVTGEIRSVSARTRMLALNATIEAARAGRAGHGFAIVASEVKALALQTAALTLDIETRLDQAKQATVDAGSSIKRVSDALDVAAGMTETIAVAAGEQSSATGSISAGISGIAADSRTAVIAINRIDTSATESTNMTGQVQDSAEAMAQRVTLLRETIDDFLARLRHADLRDDEARRGFA